MQAIPTRLDVLWFVCCHTGVPCKKDEPIVSRFGMWTHLGLRNHVLDRLQMPTGRGTFEGVQLIEKHCRVKV